MKKSYLSFIFVIYFSVAGAQKMNPAQQVTADSIFQYYNTHKQKMELAYSFKTIATVYNEDNNVQQALSYYTKSLKTYQDINDKGGIAKSYFSIGKILNSQGNHKEALQYRNKSEKIKTDIIKERATANALNKLAVSYNTQLKTQLALSTYYQCLKMYLEINDKTGILNSLNNIGTIYTELGEKKRTVNFYNLSVKIKDDCKKRACAIKAEMNNSDRIAYSFNKIATIYLKQNNYALAQAYADSSILISKQAHYTNSICIADSLLSQIDLALANSNTITATQKQNHLIDSRTHYKQYTLLHDSLLKLQAQADTRNKSTAQLQGIKGKAKNNFTLIKTTGILLFLAVLLCILGYTLIQKKQKQK